MPLMLRGGTSSEPLFSAKALATYLANPDRDPPRTKRPKSKRAMKRKIVRGSKGAKLRGGYTTPSGKVREGLRFVARGSDEYTICVED